MTIKILDLFAGVCGLSLGFEMLRDEKGRQIFELYRAVEIDNFACETLRARHGNERVIEGDLTKEEVHERVIKECKDKVTIVAGGIPCQSFSLIGPRSGFGTKIEKFKNDKRDNLYEEFRKIVSEIEPEIVVIENVKGILSKKDKTGKKIIEKLVDDFDDIGYEFLTETDKPYNLLNAADYGVPQKRERVILIGVKKGKGYKMPIISKTHYDPAGEVIKGLLPHVNLSDALGDLPEVEAKITTTGLSDKEKKELPKINELRFSGYDEGKKEPSRMSEHLKGASKQRKEYFKFVNDTRNLYHHTARSQQKSDIELFGVMGQGETADMFLKREPKKAKLIKYKMDSFKDKYRRQSWDTVSTTVFAHLEKDGNRFIHPGQPRTYTPREAARVQSFPDSFIFKGPLSKKYKQIGNAVPPLLGKAVALAVYEVLNGKKL